jgi:5-methylthioadenosine/S-adenosylhomocysteine deaminase
VNADLLLVGGVVLTMDPDRRVIENGAVAIMEDRIVAVGPEAEVVARVRPLKKIDARRKAILPGLIDAHAHGGHTLFKMIGAYLPPRTWLSVIADVYFNATTPDYWYADGLLAALERAKSGITCGVMMLGNEPRTDDPEYGYAFARGSAAIGGRTIISVGPPGPPWPRKFTRWEGDRSQSYEATYDRCLAVTEELVRGLHGTCGGRIRLMLGPAYMPAVPHNESPTSEELRVAARPASDIRRLGNRYGTFIHTHAYSGEVEHVHENFKGFLGPDVLLAHCTGITIEEQEILRELNVKVAHCPKAHRAYAARCPVPELVDLGVHVAVTSDASAPDRTFDLFEAMRAAQRLQRAHFHDPSILPPGKMLESVTIDAAAAVGLAAEIGSLEIGKKADITLVDLWRPHLVPSVMPLWQLVHAATAADVTDVFVDGRRIVADGRCVTLGEDDTLEMATEETTRMVQRANIQSLLQLPPGIWGTSRLESAVL